jgi:hypothetical protein
VKRRRVEWEVEILGLDISYNFLLLFEEEYFRLVGREVVLLNN